MGPADVPHEGGDDEAHVEVTGQDDHVEEAAALSPQGHRNVDYKTSKCRRQKLDRFFFPWRECTGILPVRQFLPLDGRRVEELSASFSCCVYSRICAAAKYTHVFRTEIRVQPKPAQQSTDKRSCRQMER